MNHSVQKAKLATKGRRNRPAKRVGIPGAERKIRQAEFFLALLGENPPLRVTQTHEPLQYYFSACLTAAQSAYHVLEKNYASKLRQAEADWRKALNDDAAHRFQWTRDLRDEDVHFAVMAAQPVKKYVSEERWERHPSYEVFSYRNVALLGHDEVIEAENPDGSKVSGRILRGTVALYLDHRGMKLEATTVCRLFIDDVRLLLDAVKAAL